jgi:hypothetical protein
MEAVIAAIVSEYSAVPLVQACRLFMPLNIFWLSAYDSRAR